MDVKEAKDAGDDVTVLKLLKVVLVGSASAGKTRCVALRPGRLVPLTRQRHAGPYLHITDRLFDCIVVPPRVDRSVQDEAGWQLRVHASHGVPNLFWSRRPQNILLPRFRSCAFWSSALYGLSTPLRNTPFEPQFTPPPLVSPW